MKYLWNRDGVLWFRRRVPEALRGVIGQREWKESLGLPAGQELAAAVRVRDLTRRTQKLIDAAERVLTSGVGQAELAVEAAEWARAEGLLAGGVGRQPLSEHGETYADLWVDGMISAALKRSGKRTEDDLDESDFDPADWMRLQTVIEGRRQEVPLTIQGAADSYEKRHRSGHMEKAESYAVTQLIDFAGDIALADLSRRQVQDWFVHLREVRNASPATIKRRHSSMRAIVQRAIEDFDLSIKNPFAGARVPAGATGSAADCLPFHTAHLAKIDDYLAAAKVRADLKAIFALLRYTGCRPSELVGLDWSDVVLDHEIPHLRIRLTHIARD